MKQKTKKIICILIMIIIVIAGIAVMSTKGFTKELKYRQSQSIDIYIEQEFDNKKIKEVANEVFGKENMVETVEVYKDMVAVRAETITEEQKNDFVNKIKEIYEFSQTVEETEIEDISTTKLRDMFGAYIMPLIISGILVLIYMVIRYYKIGTVKVATRVIFIPIIGELVLLSIIAIMRIPVGRITPILLIAMYIFTIMYVINKNEKDKKEIMSKDNKEEDSH